MHFYNHGTYFYSAFTRWNGRIGPGGPFEICERAWPSPQAMPAFYGRANYIPRKASMRLCDAQLVPCCTTCHLFGACATSLGAYVFVPPRTNLILTYYILYLAGRPFCAAKIVATLAEYTHTHIHGYCRCSLEYLRNFVPHARIYYIYMQQRFPKRRPREVAPQHGTQVARIQAACACSAWR